MGVCEVHVDPAQLGEVCVAGHLAALVPGEGAAQRLGDTFEDLDDRGEGCVRVVAFGQVRQPQVATGPVEAGDDRGAVAGTDDEVTFEVSDLDAFGRDRGSGVDEVEHPEGAGLGWGRPEHPVLAASTMPVQTLVQPGA